jgi:DNA-binding transcriptional LysR family regulator
VTHDTRRRQSGGGGVPARRALPDVKLDLCEMVTAVQLEGLMAGELDLGIARPPVKRPGLVSRPLPHEQLIAALPEAHSMATLGRQLTLNDSTARA